MAIERTPTGASEPGLIVAIVLSFDKRETTLTCLRSLRDVNYDPLEVIVVDNASTDGSADAIADAFPDFHLVRNATNRGPAGGRNAGLAYMAERFAPRWIFFADNDTSFDKDVLQHLAAALATEPNAGIACPKAYQREPSTTLFSTGVEVDFARASIYDVGCGEADRGQHDRGRAVPACGSFGVLVDPAVLAAIGGWDERFHPYGWEDVDLCLRAAEIGYTTRYVPRAVMYHAGGRAGRGVVPAYEAYKIRHFLLLMRRHASRLEMASCALWAPVRGAKMALRLARAGELRGFARRLVRRVGDGGNA